MGHHTAAEPRQIEKTFMEHPSLILIVDDQPFGLEALASLLEPEGYRLAFATNGPEAIAATAQLHPDLVLLDVMMPELDGFEVCRRIRADPALALIPVVMVTALDDQSSLLSGIEAGADDFITKPFSRTELRARVRTITRLNRFRVVLEQQRQAAREHTQLLWAIERSENGYLLLDADDRPQNGNAQAWRYLGLAGRPTPDEAAPLLDLARRSYRLEPAEAWASWPAPSGSPRYLVRPDGAHTRWLQVDLLDLPPEGTGYRMIHIEDVTDRISAQWDIWSFHSFVSHKLRTPLTSLLAGMGMLHNHARRLPPDLSMLADTAYNGAQRLKAIVDDIFSYLETPMLGAVGTGLALADLPDLVAQIGAGLPVAALHITDNLGSQQGRLTLGARTLELMLTEILENAHKFHPDHAPTVHIRLERQSEQLTIRVVDDGVSLSPAQLRRIREPYQQIDRDFSGQIPGVGLGLATVSQICWSAGGACTISSRADGVGVSVDLQLPLAPVAEASLGGEL